MTKGREKSDDRVVPESRRKAVLTAKGQGGKAVTASEQTRQLRMNLGTADSPKGDDARAEAGQPVPTVSAGAKAQEQEEKSFVGDDDEPKHRLQATDVAMEITAGVHDTGAGLRPPGRTPSVPKSRMWTHKSGSVRGTVREDGPYSTPTASALGFPGPAGTPAAERRYTY
jgi:hypothetical protein